MTWTWIEQRPHANGPESTVLHILVGTTLPTGEQTYLAFIQLGIEENTGHVGYRAIVPREAQPRGKELPQYHYLHDTLQEAKDWCVAELVNRRLDV